MTFGSAYPDELLFDTPVNYDELRQMPSPKLNSLLDNSNSKLNINDEITISYEGSTLWTAMNEVAVSGNYAYCAMFYGLAVIDISNPANPSFVSQVYIKGEGCGIALAGDYAYLADGSSGLQIINITNPASPVPAGSYFTVTQGWALGVDLANNFAYVADIFGFIILRVQHNNCCAGITGDVNCSGHPGDEEPDIADITRLIDFLYLSHAPLCCIEEADVNGSGGIPDISDITRLIDYLYLSHTPLPNCPKGMIIE